MGTKAQKRNQISNRTPKLKKNQTNINKSMTPPIKTQNQKKKKKKKPKKKKQKKKKKKKKGTKKKSA